MDIDHSLLSTDHLFPMGIKDLMHHLENIVQSWYQLGVELGLPINKLDEIECNNSSNVLRCKLSVTRVAEATDSETILVHTGGCSTQYEGEHCC